VTAFHQRNDGALLAFGITRAAQAGPLFLGTNPNFVDFYDTAQLLNHAVLSHSEAETVHHEPNRLVADSGHAVHLVSAHAFLTGTEQVGRENPAVERNMAILKYGANGDGELFAASVALPHAFANGLLGAGTRFQLTSVIDFSAVRADRAFGPADGFQQFSGVVFVANFLDEFYEIESSIMNRGRHCGSLRVLI